MIKTKFVGIINLTPDSFSDGGKYVDGNVALEAMARMIEEGASVIDIGAESTRPGAQPISPQEEWRRLEPVLKALHRVRKRGVAFSLDTRNSETAQRAVDTGIDWLNDVTGFSSQKMVEVALSCPCPLVVMHSLGVPASKSITLPSTVDPVAAVLSWGQERLAALAERGIPRERIVFDPGIGFGKTPEQSLALLRGVQAFHALGVPVFIGHSRKSFLAEFSADRDEATLTVSLWLAQQGVDYLRVHDVARHRRALSVLNALTDDERPATHRRTA